MSRRATTLPQAILLVLFFGFYFYGAGAANLEAFLNYPFWRDMGADLNNEAFMRLREDHIWKVGPLLVAPIAGLFVATLLLAVFPPSFTPRWIFLGVLACLTVAIVSTLTIQLPIQHQLTDTGFDEASFSRLIETDLLLRKIPTLIEGAFVVIALWFSIRRPNAG